MVKEEVPRPVVLVFSRHEGFVASVKGALASGLALRTSREFSYPERVVARVGARALILDFVNPESRGWRILKRLAKTGALEGAGVIAVVPTRAASPAPLADYTVQAARLALDLPEALGCILNGEREERPTPRYAGASSDRPLARWKDFLPWSPEELKRLFDAVDATFQHRCHCEERAAWTTVSERFLADPRVPCPLEVLYSAINAEVWHSTQPYNEKVDRSRIVQAIKRLRKRLRTAARPGKPRLSLRVSSLGVLLIVTPPPRGN